MVRFVAFTLLFGVCTSAPTCIVGDTVNCLGSSNKCAGNQCCPDSSTCPSADNSFTGCPAAKKEDCTSPWIPSAPMTATTTNSTADATSSPPSTSASASSTMTTTSPVTVTTMTSTVTTTSPASENPKDGLELAQKLNEAYKGYNPKDPSSGIGIVFRAAIRWEFFCPGFKSYQGCFKGSIDCTTSASIMNSKMMLRDGRMMVPMDREAGILFNPNWVENTAARCTYAYDGGIWSRYNHGCGLGAHCYNDPSCCQEGKDSAFFNVDATTGKEYAPEHEKVWKTSCENHEVVGCHWRGAAYYLDRGLNVSLTHRMLRQRMKTQAQDSSKVASWNEVVIHAGKLFEELKADPANAIWGFAYKKGNAEAKRFAAKMAEDMVAEFGGEVRPLVAWDPTIKVEGASPFSFEAAEISV